MAATALSATSSSNPLIGFSPKSIELEGAVSSKTFRVWNSGTGKLSYTVSITDGNEYFSITPARGDSNNSGDVRTHTITVYYNKIPHNMTVTGKIKIADSKSTQYIDVTATETIASHVRSVRIEHGIDCNSEQDCVNKVFKFRINIVSDNNLAQLAFVAPDGDPYEPFIIPDDNYTQDGQIETWHKTTGSEQSWTYQATLPQYNDLTTYWDGKYTIIGTYTDSNQAQTDVGFSVPQRPGAIPQPTQEPNMINPPNDSNTVSPVCLAWEKCIDVNVGSILVGYKRPSDVNWIEKQYSKSSTKAALLKLDYGRWLSEMTFGRWFESKNIDGIEITVGKYIKNYTSFMVNNQFGSFAEIKNHALQLADCNGHIVTFTLTGGGDGNVVNDCNFNNIILEGTTEKSIFSITTAGGIKTSIGNITVNGPIKAIIARNVDLKGDIFIDGAASVIVLNNVTASSNITIGFPDLLKTTCSIKFGEINDLTLSSETPIKGLTAVEWLFGSLDAPWITSLAIKGNKTAAKTGDFNASMTLSGEESPKEIALKAIKIAGNIGETTWDIIGSCGTISVAGSLDKTTWNIDGNCGNTKIAGAIDGAIWNITGNCGKIEIAESNADFQADIIGNIGTLKAVGNKKLAIPSILSGSWSFNSVKSIIASQISDCVLMAEVNDLNVIAINSIAVTGWIDNSVIETTGNTDSIIMGAIRDSTIWGGLDGDSSLKFNSLEQLKIKGIKGEAYSIINSNIMAEYIGNAYLAFPKTYNYGTYFGLTAGSIDSLTIKDPAWTHTWENLINAYDSKVFTDFVIRLQ